MSWKTAAIVVAPFVGGFVVLRMLDGGRGSAPVVPPAPSTPPGSGEPVQMRESPIPVVAGRTFFAVLETNGAVSAAANAARVKAEAEKQGFRDVVVFTQRPSNFPGGASGDYYVRATYQGAPKTLPRKTSVLFGSLVVLDVWGSV